MVEECRRKRGRLFYWAPLAHCERSLFFLLTCDLYCCRASRSGRADSWGNCGRADGQLGQFGGRERERECEGMRDRRMLEAKVNDCVGEREEGRRGEQGPCRSFTKSSPACCGSASSWTDTLLHTRVQIWPVRKCRTCELQQPDLCHRGLF